jgi:hypothetical protein
LTLATIGDLSRGQAEAIINAALRTALSDTEDRGADKKARKVTIEVEMKKIGNDGISVSVKATPKLPNYATDATVGEIILGEKGQAEMTFSPAVSERSDQPPLNGIE